MFKCQSEWKVVIFYFWGKAADFLGEISNDLLLISRDLKCLDTQLNEPTKKIK